MPAGSSPPAGACPGRTILPREAGEGDANGWVWGDDGATIPPDAPLPGLLSVALRLLGSFMGCAAQGTGVSPAGLGLVRLLAARDGLRSSDVAARGWWTPGTVTAIADTLVRNGYVERRRDERDRRVVRLYLTEQGRHKAEEAASVIGTRLRGAFDYVDPADEPVIRKFLVETIERFGELTREARPR